MEEGYSAYIEKKGGFDIEAKKIEQELKVYLKADGIKNLRIIYCYEVFCISSFIFDQAVKSVFSETVSDLVYDKYAFERIKLRSDFSFGMEYLLGQFDQRADAAEQCIRIIEPSANPRVKCRKYILISGEVCDEVKEKIKSYLINPTDSMESSDKVDITFSSINKKIPLIKGFIGLKEAGLLDVIKEYALAMTLEDILFCQNYFKDKEKRDPTLTEIKILDTYWSDHCRHTTFLTRLQDIEFENGKVSNSVKKSYELFLKEKKSLNRDLHNITLMEIATLGAKSLKKQGFLDNLDESDEINACSIKVDVDVNGINEKYLVQFKNETHNHPTEIEPFGGAATCLGGAIRDPLSGRAYVYQGMRVTGSGDPRRSIDQTIPGKLPQRRITKEAANGFSSYGNQIGLATGIVSEIYDDGYQAKRMEVGAVIGAVPFNNVVREKPEPGDVVILLGGKTGRDGCGGATGSSKSHNEESISMCGAEVQKGNPPEERKIQRLFRNENVSQIIKKCNDFGAGGVSVAVGELAEGLDIYLDAIPKKYEDLDGTELSISESQERMAVVISKENEKQFIESALRENLEAVRIADITSSNRMRMFWNQKKIVDISRDFLNSSGEVRKTNLKVCEPNANEFPLQEKQSESFKEAIKTMLANLNICSKQGLVEQFDSSIGACTVLFPFGGKYKKSPIDAMVSKIPILHGETTTCTAMSYAYNLEISKWSSYLGAIYSIIESVSKTVSVGCDYKTIRLSLQEYFERLGTNPEKWGKVFSALLGAFEAQMRLEIGAIGGKDSMSGSFNDINVPPTLISFSLGIGHVKNIVSPEFKKAGHYVYVAKITNDYSSLPDFERIKKIYSVIHEKIGNNLITSSSVVGFGAIGCTIAKMCFGNKIGFRFDGKYKINDLFLSNYGAIVFATNTAISNLESNYIEFLGITEASNFITLGEEKVSLDELLESWESPLENVFHIRKDEKNAAVEIFPYVSGTKIKCRNKTVKPKVFIPIFPGSNCEYDSARVFEKAGAIVNSMVFCNIKKHLIDESIKHFVDNIKNSQILMIPGGFSAGDEPEGAGKFIANVIRNPSIRDSIYDLLDRDGLILGICNGFQALIKTGLLPFGAIRESDEYSPTLTFNSVGRHVSDFVNTRVVSNLSPWFSKTKVGEVHTIAISHGEGRLVADERIYMHLVEKGQISTQYCDYDGNVTMSPLYNPNGASFAVEGITSCDGKILGKMGHSERIGKNLYKNIYGNMDQKIFESGVEYFS